MTDEAFKTLVTEAVAAIPDKFKAHLDNVAFLIADTATPDQLEAGEVTPGGILLGLYEGIPLPERGDGYSMVVPDTITIFRQPHLELATDEAGLRDEVHLTVWHEVAHYFGLDHDQIDRLEAEARGNVAA